MSVTHKHTTAPLEWLPGETVEDAVMRVLADGRVVSIQSASDAAGYSSVQTGRALQRLADRGVLERGRTKAPTGRVVMAFRLKEVRRGKGKV